MGALTGSRASTEPCGLGPSGFDPSRFAGDIEKLINECDEFSDRILDNDISTSCCEDVEQLETFHDNLVRDVAGLSAILRHALIAIAMEARQCGDGTAPSRSDDSAARRDRPEPGTHKDER